MMVSRSKRKLAQSTRQAMESAFRVQCDDGARTAEVAALLTSLAIDGKLHEQALENVLLKVYGDLLHDPLSQLVWFFPERPADWRPLHALNACRTAMFVGMRQGKDEAGVMQLGVIGLLYDLGMWNPELRGLWGDAGPLDEQAMELLSPHPSWGAERIEGAGLPDNLAITAAREHHERPDGSGYPRGVSRNRLHAVSLLFQLIDSLLGQIEPRPFRRARSPLDAMARLVMQAQRGHYDLPTLRSFLVALGLYPVGSAVRLSSGEWAIVEGVNEDDLKRPPVRLITDEGGEPRKRPVSIRLADYPALAVEDDLSADEAIAPDS